MPSIPNSTILIVATDGFEEWELFGPREILQKRGAEVVLASLKLDPIQATVHDDPGKTIRPDLTVDDANADDFDALILPGGVRNPDQLRIHGNVIELIKAFDEQEKPIGAICHGPWLLVEADLLREPHRHELAIDPHRPTQRRRQCCRRGGGHRRQYRHQPQPERRRSLHQRAHRAHREYPGGRGNSAPQRIARLTELQPIERIRRGDERPFDHSC